MRKFTFYLYYNDPMAQPLPGLQIIEADSLKDAVRLFCREHSLRFESRDGEVMWFTTRGGESGQYEVRERRE